VSEEEGEEEEETEEEEQSDSDFSSGSEEEEEEDKAGLEPQPEAPPNDTGHEADDEADVEGLPVEEPERKRPRGSEPGVPAAEAAEQTEEGA
jgi:hypothetical protein